jgi:hypothetical protein
MEMDVGDVRQEKRTLRGLGSTIDFDHRQKSIGRCNGNIQYLDDYWRFDAVGVASETREIVQTEVSAAPGLCLSDLFRNTHGFGAREN